VSSRPLHAVLLPPEPGGGRLLAALSAALDGTGPAILPLDPGLPPARLRQLLEVFRPSVLQTPDGTQRLAPPDPDGPAQPGVAPDIAVVVATSGSTGQPKGVQLTAGALRASAASSMARIGAGPGQRWLACLPGFHVAGLQVLIRSLLAGTEPVVSSGIDAAVIAAAGCAYVSLVPTQLRRLIEAGAPLDSFDTILLGGAAPGGTLLDDARAAGGRVVVTYGMSETCGGCVYDGWPLDGVRVRIDSGGLIGIAGPVLFSGYRPASGQPAADAGGQPTSDDGWFRTSDDGWFRTSDLGSLDADGRLTVRGRADDVINTGGEKVVPGEVEAVLGTIGGVADVVVIGMPDSEWGELVTAVVVPADPAAPPELSQLRGHARDRLPGYAAPRRMLLASRIPLLPSGKPDRIALRRTARENPGGEQHPR
jgi:o-succinylbenzoate---CoA ligase